MKLITTSLLCFQFFFLAGQSPDLSFQEINQLGNISEFENISLADLREIGTKLFNNRECKKAYLYFKQLVIKNSDVAEDYYYFSQCLKVKEEYKTAEYYMKMYAEKTDVNYNQIPEEFYFSEFSKSSYLYHITHLDLNTKNSEFPFRADENTINFISDRQGKEKHDYAFERKTYSTWQGKISENGIDELHKTSNKNDVLIDGGRAVSIDGTLSFHTENDLKTGQLKIIRSHEINGEWKNTEEVHFNSNDYSVAQPVFSFDEKKLYFVSNMPGGYGQTDIYSSIINEDGSLGKAVNLGNKVNTLSKESFPFVNEKNELYFASSGHNTLGGFDIFMFSLNDKSKAYKRAKNLGEPINSIYDDFAYVQKNDSSGFFASNRVDGLGKDDIYQFSIKSATYETNEYEAALKMLFHGFDFKNSSIPLIEVNENGSYTSEKMALKPGKYVVYSETAEPDKAEFKTVYFTDSTYDYQAPLSGKFYAIKKEPLPISESKMVLETIKTTSDSSYLSQKEIAAGNYFLIHKDLWLSDKLKNSLNQVTFNTDGTYSTVAPLVNEDYFLLTENTSWVSTSTENMKNIQFLDDRTYIPKNLISNGQFYLLPKDTLTWSELDLNFQTISIKSDKTFQSKNAISEDIYYVIPQLTRKSEAQLTHEASENSEIIFYEKSTLLNSDAQLELLRILIQMRHYPHKKLLIEPDTESHVLDSEMTLLIMKRNQKIEEFLLSHGAKKDRIIIQELNIETNKSGIETENLIETKPIRTFQKFNLKLI